MDPDSDTSSLLTISPSLRQSLYRYDKDARRFQSSNDNYAWPCDGRAFAQEGLIAEILGKTYANGLYWEPYEGALEEVLSASSSEGQPRLIDLGSGAAASWSISMAERFPHVECIGIDLVPSDLDYLPSNLSIELCDLIRGLPYPDDYFSLIHCRYGAAASFFENPSCDFLSEIARTLRPGGLLLLEHLHDSSTA